VPCDRLYLVRVTLHSGCGISAAASASTSWWAMWRQCAVSSMTGGWSSAAPTTTWSRFVPLPPPLISCIDPRRRQMIIISWAQTRPEPKRIILHLAVSATFRTGRLWKIWTNCGLHRMRANNTPSLSFSRPPSLAIPPRNGKILSREKACR
jgi:hypothetical protein